MAHFEEMGLEKTLSLINEAHEVAVREGEDMLAYLLRMAFLEASERVELKSNRDSQKNNDQH